MKLAELLNERKSLKKEIRKIKEDYIFLQKYRKVIDQWGCLIPSTLIKNILVPCVMGISSPFRLRNLKICWGIIM